MLFSEPKIPQSAGARRTDGASQAFQCSSASRKFLKRCGLRQRKPAAQTFQCSSASRKFLKLRTRVRLRPTLAFQCSSASRKFLKSTRIVSIWRSCDVSVLFSEPKIPQTRRRIRFQNPDRRFSALQRAENSSKNDERVCPICGALQFQCSSASRKFLKSYSSVTDIIELLAFQCSSASRKFLKAVRQPHRPDRCGFQCSSASRKFLKRRGLPAARGVVEGFSALQRAENSSNSSINRTSSGSAEFQCSSASRKFLKSVALTNSAIETPEFQCSSASRKFLKEFVTPPAHALACVSVLFSEPKIPQNWEGGEVDPEKDCFSALQRAENSSNRVAPSRRCPVSVVSVLFSEPKIPQTFDRESKRIGGRRFSALQRAENSSNCVVFRMHGYDQTFQCSSASRKFLK